MASAECGRADCQSEDLCLVALHAPANPHPLPVLLKLFRKWICIVSFESCGETGEGAAVMSRMTGVYGQTPTFAHLRPHQVMSAWYHYKCIFNAQRRARAWKIERTDQLDGWVGMRHLGTLAWGALECGGLHPVAD